MSTSLRIIFAGTSDFSAHHLDALISSKHNIVGVLTQPDRPSGRGRKLTLSPVKFLAEKKKIPVFQPLSLHSIENQKLLASLNSDVIVVVSYGCILPKNILDMPRFGCINVHGSLLPRWRGAAPIQHSLLAGDIETGVTIIQMDIGLDTGNILYKLSCPISGIDTSATLFNKLSKLGSKGLIETLQKIVKKEIIYEVQDESLVTYAKKINRNDARINWFLSANKIERCIRAFNPWPISWTKINDQSVKIWRASVINVNTPDSSVPGTILSFNKKGIQVSTTVGVLNLELLQLTGKKIVRAQDLLNSHYEWFVPNMRFS